jgi:hypothetical protein
MKGSGKGFARLVTIANLQSFVGVLATAADRARQRQTSKADKVENDPAIEAAKKLFVGSAIGAQVSLKRARRVRSGKALSEAISREADVLFAEIPKGSDRWNQANFSKDIFESFFHASAGERLVLVHVADSGVVAPEEIRQGVLVKSRNYRFELGAASRLAYPSAGRPIGVFAPGSEAGRFLYMLLLPGSINYEAAASILESYSKATRGDRMKRQVVARAAAVHAWPNSPLWKVH